MLNLDDTAINTPAPAFPGPEKLAETTTNNDQNEEKEEEEQEFEFRLFSHNKPTSQDVGDNGVKLTAGAGGAQQTQKLRIRLRSPSPAPGDGRFVNPFRRWDYYFSAPNAILKGRVGDDSGALEEKKREFEDVAVDGGVVLGWAAQSWVCLLTRTVFLGRYLTFHYSQVANCRGG